MSSDINVTAQHWSNHVERFSGRNAGLFWWEAGSEVDRHINSKISGEPDVDWLEYSLRKYFDGRLPLTRCLSLGCGSGHLERTLAQLGAFQHCDAYDVAEETTRQIFDDIDGWWKSDNITNEEYERVKKKWVKDK